MPDFPATDPLFLSTLSLRRATPRPSPSCHPVWDFYPRSPCGERLVKAHGDGVFTRFLSTLSLRRATRFELHFCFKLKYFYPRSPCGERPQNTEHLRRNAKNFYPRSPCGERPCFNRSQNSLFSISIHALLAESDTAQRKKKSKRKYFYPRSPCGERRPLVLSVHDFGSISIHALLAESDQN